MNKKKSNRKLRRKSTALVRQPSLASPPSALSVIERLAKDRTVDVSKLKELIQLQQEMMATQAKIEFERAFQMMKPELPIIKKRGIIAGKNKEIRYRYARLGEDIQPTIEPILAKYGFNITFQTSWPKDGIVHVDGVLTHVGGHSKHSAFEGPEDKSENRSYIQGLGSTTQYGRRYTTIDLLNLILQGVDDDGTRSPRRPTVVVDAEGRAVPDAHHRHLDDVITLQQRGHIVGLVQRTGRTENEFLMWLKIAYGLDSTKTITRRNFDVICKAIEAQGPLPVPEREPGSDDE